MKSRSFSFFSSKVPFVLSLYVISVVLICVTVDTLLLS